MITHWSSMCILTVQSEFSTTHIVNKHSIVPLKGDNEERKAIL